MHSTPRSATLFQPRVGPFSTAAFTLFFVLAGASLVLLTITAPATAMVVGAWVALYGAARALGPLAVSPAVIVSAGLAVVAVAGRLLYPLVVDARFATGIYLPADPEMLNRGFYGLTGASLAVSAGSIIVGVFTKRPGGRFQIRPVQISRKVRDLLVIGAPTPTFGLIAYHGVAVLLERGQYIPEGASSGLAGLLKSALVVTLVISGYLWHTQRGAGRAVVALNIVLSTAYLISTGSRLFAGTFALLAIGYFFARIDRRARWVLAASVVAAMFLVPLPLYWRALDVHGLIPYLSSMSGYFGTEFGLATTAKTILISVPITGATAAANLPAASLRVALDPRSGEAAGWYDIASQMRLNIYSPMSGVGELQNHGAIVLAVFFVLLGIYLGFLDRHVRRTLTRGHQLIAFAHVGLISLCLVYFIQYNLRSSMRMVYYSVALWIIYKIWIWARTRRRQHMTWPHPL